MSEEFVLLLLILDTMGCFALLSPFVVVSATISKAYRNVTRDPGPAIHHGELTIGLNTNIPCSTHAENPESHQLQQRHHSSSGNSNKNNDEQKDRCKWTDKQNQEEPRKSPRPCATSTGRASPTWRCNGLTAVLRYRLTQGFDSGVASCKFERVQGRLGREVRIVWIC